MHTPPPLTAPRITGHYQPLLSSAETSTKRPPPATPAISRHLGFASSSSVRVTLNPPSGTDRPAGRGWPFWQASLLGVTLLGGMAGVTRLRAGNADRDAITAAVQHNDPPLHLPLHAANGGEFTMPPAKETITIAPAPASSGLDPYRGHVPTPGDGTFAAGLNEKNGEITRFLQKNNILPDDGRFIPFSMEEITAAVAKYLASTGRKGKRNIAELILAATDIHGGYQHETLSSAQVDIAVRHWLFDNMLGTSPEIALAIRVSNDSYPFMFTVDSVVYLLSSAGLQASGKVNFNTLAEPDQAMLKSQWDSEVQKEIPLLAYYGRDPQVKCLSLDDVDFASLFSGSLFLYENGINLGDIHWREVVKTGGLLWDIALRDGVTADMLRYYSLPALFFQAINHPEKLNAEQGSHLFLLRTTALDDYLAYRVQVRKAIEDLGIKFNRYQDAVKQWLTRSQLADSIIERCPGDTVFPLTSIVNPAMTREQRKSEGKKQAKEAYLNNVLIPCKTAPESLDDEYKKHANTVADRFAELEKILITSALGSVEKKERDFILSEHAIIHRLRIIPFIKANGMIPALRDNGAGHYDFDNINDADVFSVNLSGDKRYYALKGKAGHGYDIFRFDQYLPHDDSAQYSNLHPLIAFFGGLPGKSLIKNEDQKNDSLVIFLTNSHRETFYNALYQSGYTPSDLQKIWAVAKHLIPLYDCIEGAVNHDVAQAVPACLLDAVAFLSVAAKITDLSQRFGASILKGLSRSQIVFAGNPLTKNTVKAAGTQLIHHVSLPSGKEMTSLMTDVLRAADPGVQLISAISRNSISKMIKHFEHYNSGKQFDNIIAKLKSAALKNRTRSPAPLDENLKFARDGIPPGAKKIGPPARTDGIAGAATDTGGNPGQKIHHAEDGNRLLSPVKDPISQTIPATLAGRRHEPQKIQYMFNHHHGRAAHAAQAMGIADSPVDLDSIPKRSEFIKPMDHYYAMWYPNKFDHGNDIANSLRQHYALPTVYQFRYGEDILKIPAEFHFLRNHISTFIQGVDKANAYAAIVKHKFDRTTMLSDSGILQYPINNEIKTYLANVLGTKDKNILTQAMTRLKYRTDQIVRYFEKSKHSIIFATGSTPAHPYVYRRECPMGFTYPDDVDNRVIILVDNFLTAPILSTHPHLTVLHEISHHSGSLDFLISPSTSRLGDASEFLESFNEALTRQGDDIVAISDDFARAVNFNSGGAVLSKEDIAQLFLRDPMLKANAIMDNADFLATFISDIAKKKAFNHDYINPRNKRSKESTQEEKIAMALFSYICQKAMTSTYNSGPDAI